MLRSSGHLLGTTQVSDYPYGSSYTCLITKAGHVARLTCLIVAPHVRRVQLKRASMNSSCLARTLPRMNTTMVATNAGNHAYSGAKPAFSVANQPVAVCENTNGHKTVTTCQRNNSAATAKILKARPTPTLNLSPEASATNIRPKP